ncbi:hypothetical protein AX15_000128 [Amanita polypyramis BW_CC]|nr:hypothetical protein AX15_000128 [Amanita polypyramis BW_CC]
MNVDEPRNKRRSWTTYIPRPGSRSKESGSRPSFTAKPLVPVSPGEDQGLGIVSVSTSGSSGAPALTNNSPLLRPSTPKRWTLSLLPPPPPLKCQPQELDQQTVLNALERASTHQPSSPRGSFGRMSFSSMMGGFSSLSLTRTLSKDPTADKTNGNSEEGRPRGRRARRPKSASQATTGTESDVFRARSQSPFTFHRFRSRESSPAPQSIPLAQSDADLSDASTVHPRLTSFTDEPDSSDDLATDAETEDEDDKEDHFFDTITERNTEQNAQTVPVAPGLPDVEEPDPLGEGVNVVVPHEPYFPSTLNPRESPTRGRRGTKRRKSIKHEPLALQTSRPAFERDRCTTTITQGDPEAKLEGRKSRLYMVASDLGEESRYALEWGIGTVLRDGDDLLVVHVIENESKVDPPFPNTADRATKLRSQQERQGFAFILVRQSTSLLQRTKLNVKVICQAWHAKNARHMLLDIADYYEPTMLIVGSRGLRQLSGILLGSTSHYLIQKCSVPVMVARRRLKRPPKKSAHLVKNRTHVPLAKAAIDRWAAKVDTDVQTMRDEMERDEKERHNERPSGIQPSMRDAPSIPEEDEGELDEEDEVDCDDVPREIQVK